MIKDNKEALTLALALAITAPNDKKAAKCVKIADSLGVKELSDGRILINCFAGCGITNILGNVGLSLDDIVPKRLGDFKPVRKAFNPYSVLKTVSHETLLVALASIELSKGKTLPLEDHKRLMLAAERLRQAYSLCH